MAGEDEDFTGVDGAEALDAPELELAEDLSIDSDIDTGDKADSEGGGRVARLARERGEYRDRSRMLEEQNRMLMESMQQRPQQSHEDESLDPMQKWTKNVERTLQQQQFQNSDLIDQTRFETKAESRTIYKKYQGRVEEELTKMRRAGSNAPRETILAYLIGKAAMDVDTAPRQRQAAAKRAATETQPANMRSTVNASSKREPSLKERLSNVLI